MGRLHLPIRAGWNSKLSMGPLEWGVGFVLILSSWMCWLIDFRLSSCFPGETGWNLGLVERKFLLRRLNIWLKQIDFREIQRKHEQRNMYDIQLFKFSHWLGQRDREQVVLRSRGAEILHHEEEPTELPKALRHVAQSITGRT